VALVKTAIVADMSAARQLGGTAFLRRVTLKGAKAAANLVAPRARAAAPRRKGSGALRQSIGVKAEAGKKRTGAIAVVGARKKVVKTVPRGKKTVKAVPAFYAHLVEKGTKAHSLGKGAKLGRKGKPTVGQDAGKKHPGAKPEPFLGPAWEAVKDQAGAAATAAIGAEVQKEIAKRAAKAAKLTG
jgi:HK97 gp10 family phage protein